MNEYFKFNLFIFLYYYSVFFPFPLLRKFFRSLVYYILYYDQERKRGIHKCN